MIIFKKIFKEEIINLKVLLSLSNEFAYERKKKNFFDEKYLKYIAKIKMKTHR